MYAWYLHSTVAIESITSSDILRVVTDFDVGITPISQPEVAGEGESVGQDVEKESDNTEQVGASPDIGN